jgi:hypothetical protein
MYFQIILCAIVQFDSLKLRQMLKSVLVNKNIFFQNIIKLRMWLSESFTSFKYPTEVLLHIVSPPLIVPMVKAHAKEKKNE